MSESDVHVNKDDGRARELWLVAILVGAIVFWPALIVGVVMGVSTIKAAGVALFSGLLSAGLSLVLHRLYTVVVCHYSSAEVHQGCRDRTFALQQTEDKNGTL